MNKYVFPIAMWLIFEAIAITLWLTSDNAFYLFNFSYIGTCIAVCMTLLANKFKYARNILQIAVGLYMLVFLGVLQKENMQIEGFWHYLFLGVFEAAVIHYVVAKIFGPLIFGRGWCGHACWTAMVLDLLPYKIPQQPRKKIGVIRYIVFIVSFLFVGALYILHIPNIEQIMYLSLIIGNILYYAVGIWLAFAFKDNRAFCKYICPITVLLKPASYYSIVRIKNDTDKCISCGRCNKICPMNVEVQNTSRKRVNGTECVLCFNCVNECPTKSLHI